MTNIGEGIFDNNSSEFFIADIVHGGVMSYCDGVYEVRKHTYKATSTIRWNTSNLLTLTVP